MIAESSGRLPFVPVLTVILMAAFGVALLSLSSGAFPLTGFDVVGVFSGLNTDAVARMVVLEVRLPRLLLGFLVGAVLAVSGSLLQGLFRNPLADPGLIGVSAGASLAAIAGAATGLLTFHASDEELRSLTFWTMGSLGHASWEDLMVAGPWLILALLLAPALARPMDAFLLGEAVVGHLGYPADRIKRMAVLVAGLGVGAAVAVSGLIGFVGLVVPHLIRQLLGASHRVVLPLSGLAGGVLLVAADCLARVVVAPAELPIGLMMALIGGPVFLMLLLRMRIH